MGASPYHWLVLASGLAMIVWPNVARRFWAEPYQGNPRPRASLRFAGVAAFATALPAGLLAVMMWQKSAGLALAWTGVALMSVVMAIRSLRDARTAPIGSGLPRRQAVLLALVLLIGAAAIVDIVTDNPPIPPPPVNRADP